MKKIILLTIVLFASCQKQYSKKFIVSKSDDNNWTTTASIECDSVSMTDIHTAVLWSDGQKIVLKGQIIKIYSTLK